MRRIASKKPLQRLHGFRAAAELQKGRPCGRLRTAFSIKQEALFVIDAPPIDDVAQGIFSSQLGHHNPRLLLVLACFVLIAGFARLVALEEEDLAEALPWNRSSPSRERVTCACRRTGTAAAVPASCDRVYPPLGPLWQS
jgi:hypothetical protein